MSLSDLINQLNSSYTQHQQYINQQHTYNLNYLNELLKAHPVIGQVLSEEDRIKEIDKELDIIRGILPTPKGYKVDKSKVKSLLRERKDLSD